MRSGLSLDGVPSTAEVRDRIRLGVTWRPREMATSWPPGPASIEEFDAVSTMVPSACVAERRGCGGPALRREPSFGCAYADRQHRKLDQPPSPLARRSRGWWAHSWKGGGSLDRTGLCSLMPGFVFWSLMMPGIAWCLGVVAPKLLRTFGLPACDPYLAAAALRGRPPRRPFARELAALRSLVRRPTNAAAVTRLTLARA
jgi:hypothetical protein